MAYTPGTSRNIIVGAAAVYLSTGDGSRPRTVVTGAGRVLDKVEADTNYDNVGFTSEGIEVSYEPDYGDVEVDQLLDSALIFKQSMRVTVNTSLTEATLENLLVVWGQRTGSLNTGTREVTIEGGALGDYPLERSIQFIGPGPRTGSDSAPVQNDRLYHLSRAIQTESSSHALRRNEATMFPVSFRILPDSGSSVGAYGTIIEKARS